MVIRLFKKSCIQVKNITFFWKKFVHVQILSSSSGAGFKIGTMAEKRHLHNDGTCDDVGEPLDSSQINEQQIWDLASALRSMGKEVPASFPSPESKQGKT